MNYMKHMNATSGLLFLLTAYGVSSAYGAEFRSGAYSDLLQNGVAVCVSDATLAEMRANIWQQKMKKRGKNCQITESYPLPSIRKWKATCSDEQGHSYLYDLSVAGSLPSEKKNRLTIDSKIVDQAGELKAKQAFLGEYLGACNAAMPAFSHWDYLDLPDRRALQAVASELLYCGAIYSGASLRAVDQKKAGLLQLGTSLTEASASVLPDDPEFLKRELVVASNRAADDLVSSSPEKLLALMKSPPCASYLEQDGVTSAIRKKSVELGR
jgi:hypothetical protein